MSQPKTLIWWVRNDQRLHDNACLQELAGVDALLPVVILPERDLAPAMLGANALDFPRASARRWQCWLQSIADLRTQLQARGSDLLVLRGEARVRLAQLAEQIGALAVHCSVATGSEEMLEQTAVARALAPFGIPLRAHWQHTLVEPDSLPFSPDQLPRIYTEFRGHVERSWRATPPLPSPSMLPPRPLDVICQAAPTLAELGFTTPPDDNRSGFPFMGGETAGLARLADYCFTSRALGHYKETRNEMIGLDYASKLSTWLAQGALSPRQIYAEIKHYERRFGSNASTYWLVFELWWRDFFELTAARIGAALFQRDGILKQPKPRHADAATFDRWRQGQTGDALVDAAMRELAATGYLSNRARQNAASFLIHDLGLDWRLGAAWFEHHLLDYSPAANYGNWQYIAGVGNDPRPVRRFDTERQAKRYDPDGAYRRLWLGDDFATRPGGATL